MLVPDVFYELIVAFKTKGDYVPEKAQHSRFENSYAAGHEAVYDCTVALMRLGDGFLKA